ncbi:hypothetical protein CISIN_1g042241mg [Citrus sinensis]|uniref:Uncharacterized protein n=1 Tax=Citrus sinensis TaxID=2711 RepID=A0A067E593_CITSI|nr:hypothetical protein CISIN_1g042241mg [Citrus sinensis]
MKSGMKSALTQSQPKKTKHSQPPSPQPLTQLIALNLPLKSAVIIRLEKPQAMRRPMEAVVEPTRGGMPRIEIHDPHKLDGWSRQLQRLLGSGGGRILKGLL